MLDKKIGISSIATLAAARRSEDERSEAERSGAVANVGAESTARPNPEVVAKAKRRRFTGSYKQRILVEADAAKKTGTFGALLRRERLYSSLLVTWRRERDAGIVKGLTPAKRGPKSKRNPLDAEVDQLRRQNVRLTEDLRKAAIVIDVQKKLATLLETLASQEEAAEKLAGTLRFTWLPMSACSQRVRLSAWIALRSIANVPFSARWNATARSYPMPSPRSHRHRL